jgi:hypothetical protein
VGGFALGCSGEPLAGLLHIHVRETEEVLAQDLPFSLLGELRVAVALDEVLRELEVPEGV